MYPNGISSLSIGPYRYCKIHYCTVSTLCYCTVPHGLCGQAATGLSAFSIASILASGECHFKYQHIAQLPSGTVSSPLPLSRVHEQENSNQFIEHRPVCCTVQLQYSTVHAPAIYCIMCSTRPHVSSEILWWLLRCLRAVASRPTNGLHLLPRGAYMHEVPAAELHAWYVPWLQQHGACSPLPIHVLYRTWSARSILRRAHSPYR